MTMPSYEFSSFGSEAEQSGRLAVQYGLMAAAVVGATVLLMGSAGALDVRVSPGVGALCLGAQVGGLAFALGRLLASAQVTTSAQVDAAGQPKPPGLGRANRVTMLRTSLVALTLALALEGQPLSSGGIIVAVAGLVALALDGVDGWLARRDGTSSRFGAWFDQEVDAALVAALSIFAWRSGACGPWILAAGALRYAFLATLWALPRMRGELPFSQRRRVVCVAQISGLLICAVPWLPPRLQVFLAACSVLALTASFAVDALFLWRTGVSPQPVTP